MRKIIRYIFWTILVLGMVFTYFDPRTYFKLFLSENVNESLLEKPVKSKLTYLVSKEEWLTFEIKSYATQLKFISTANFIPDIAKIEDNRHIRYSLEYELFDDDDLLLDSKIHHMKTSFSKFLDENKTLIQTRFYLDVPLKPNISQSFFIGLKNHPNARKIRLKVKSKDPRIVDIAIRNYYLEEIPEYKREITWERMSKEKKEHLARANVYSIEYLNSYEKYHIVSSLWKPNGPIGVEGKDYQVRRLYLLTELDNIYLDESVEPEFYADANLTGTRYLLKGKYEITFKPLTEDANNVVLKYYIAKVLVDTKTYQVDKIEKTVMLEIEEDGLIEVMSNKPIAIRLKDAVTEEVLELPSMISRYYYQLDSNHSIDYGFFTEKKRFIRVECRSENMKTGTLTISIKDKNNNAIKVLKHTLQFTPSSYDYINPFIPQSEPNYVYFELPANASLLHFSSSENIKIRIATRSNHMMYPVYSFFKDSKPQFFQLSSWFTLRPLHFNHENYKAMERTLHKQIRPPYINPFIALGQYRYKQLFPEGDWRGHALILKRPLQDNYIRPQSWASIYAHVSAKGKTELYFYDDIGLQETSPMLIYNHKGTYKKPVSIYIDDILVKSEVLHGNSGSITLPSLNIEKSHILHFSPSEEIDFFINHTKTDKGMYFKRNFIVFDKSLKFKINKRFPEESIGFQLATDINSTGDIIPFTVYLDLNSSNDIKLYTSYTFEKYRLEAGLSQKKAIHLASKNKTLSVSEPMYLKLGENLPVGEYTIIVNPPKNIYKSYLFINHLMLNTKPKTRVSKEIL